MLAGNPWCSLTYKPVTVISASIITCHSPWVSHFHIVFFSLCLCLNVPFLIKTVNIGLVTILIQQNLIFTSLHLKRPFLQIRSHPEGVGGHEFWKGTIQLSTYLIFQAVKTDSPIQSFNPKPRPVHMPDHLRPGSSSPLLSSHSD